MLRTLLAIAVVLLLNRVLPGQLAPTPAEPQQAAPATGKIDAATAAQILARTYEETKEATSADDFGRVIEVCERALASAPPENIRQYARQLASWAYNRRGEVYADRAASLFNQGAQRQANELDALALDDFQAAVRHDSTRWKAIHNRGVSLALHGKVEEALADFDQALGLQPDFVNSRFNRAEIRAQQRQWHSAVEDYSGVLKIKGDDCGALLGRGRAYLNLDKPTEAKADFDEVLRHQPQSAAAYAGRGDAQSAAGRWNQAGEDYRQAITLDPQLGSAYRGVGWLLATCPVEQFRSVELALASAEKAISLAGEGDWTTLDVLAAAQASAGRYSEAQDTMEKALALAPEDARAALEARQRLYAAEQPYRQSEPTASASGQTATR